MPDSPVIVVGGWTGCPELIARVCPRRYTPILPLLPAESAAAERWQSG